MNQNSNYTILIVDDVAKNINLLGMILRKEGYKIAFANNGKKAIETARNIIPDLILLDVMMPELDGFDTCEILKSDDKTKDIPIIFLTAKTDAESIVKGFEVGGADYVLKPFNQLELLSRMKHHLHLKTYQDSLIKANTELNTNLQNRNKMISILSHDLRSPLAGVISLSDVMIYHYDKISEDEKKEYLQEFNKSLKSQLQLLEELLSWARLQNSDNEITMDDYRLHDEVDGVLNHLITTATNKGVNINNNIDESLVAFYDSSLINSVVRNIVSNAIKFTPHDGEIHIDAEIIEDNFINVKIKDTGIGMPQSIIERLFQFGENISRRGTENEKGSGFGLILCKEMVEKNNGKIKVSSKESEGTLVEFTVQKSKNF